MKKKWRGIATIQVHKNENKAKTIVNRLGQKSISLPRIDDKKRWAGFPSLAGTARKIADLIPFCNYYVEPFSGTAKVFQMMDMSVFDVAVLNDKSKFIYRWLKKEMKYPYTIIDNNDFRNCVNLYNDRDTVFLFDPPWYQSYYDQKFSCFNRDSVKDYDNEILNLCESIRGKFIITTRKENKRMLDSKFKNYLVESEYVLCGRYPKVMLTTNMTYRRLERV